IGGFDPQFRAAGDDVDVCWRLQEQGWTLGFSPGAMVWHQRRNSIRAYWKQQKGYGKAEAMLEKKWPEKYNAAGHVAWAGRIYANGHPRVLGWANRIYHGIWGTAPFQMLYQPAPGTIRCLPLIPEWYIVILTLAVLSATGAVWSPLLMALPLFAFAVAAPLVQALLAARRASFTGTARSYFTGLKLRGLTAFLHLLQPLARLYGRVRWGLTPWRRGGLGSVLPRPRHFVTWSEQWKSPEERLQAIEAAIRAQGVVAPRGGNYDRWDLEVRGGLLGGARLLMATEEHGAGKQLLRFRLWPRCSTLGLVTNLLFGTLAVGATLDHAAVAFAVTCGTTVLLALRTFKECAGGVAIIHRILRSIEAPKSAGEATSIASVPSTPVGLDVFQLRHREVVPLPATGAAATRARIVRDEKSLEPTQR
ncbi:MAG TPA: glycosyltransferase family 2 protein, partial [Candidatus Acidoferrales bacterium]|nr:glycosyltransferase family 2 protein [Candidatus Acidoferrales bacterium]